MAMFGEPLEEEEEAEAAMMAVAPPVESLRPRVAQSSSSFKIFDENSAVDARAAPSSSFKIFDENSAGDENAAAAAEQAKSVQKGPRQILRGLEPEEAKSDIRAAPTQQRSFQIFEETTESTGFHHKLEGDSFNVSSISHFEAGGSFLQSTPFTRAGMPPSSGPMSSSAASSILLDENQGESSASAISSVPRRGLASASRPMSTRVSLSPITEISHDSSGASAGACGQSVCAASVMEAASCNTTVIAASAAAANTSAVASHSGSSVSFPVAAVAKRQMVDVALDGEIESLPGYAAVAADCAVFAAGATIAFPNGTQLEVLRPLLQTPGAKYFLAAPLEEIAVEGAAPIQYILKVDLPASAWELFVSSQIQTRLHADRAASGFGRCEFFYSYNDCSVAAIRIGNECSLQDVVDMNVQSGKPMDEPVVMFYAIELLRLLGGLSAAQMVHGGLHPAAVLLRSDGLETDWEGTWMADGAGGWADKGIFVPSFHTTVDLSILPPGTHLVGSDKNLSKLKLAEWTFEIDQVAVANIIHLLLHNEPLEVEWDADASEWRCAKPLRRYWQMDLWAEFFRGLLNARGAADVAGLRARFEGYLVQNPYKAKMLKAALMKQEIKLFEARA
eukprot:m.65139 g.65139  ORF g.65139 m.65139 type:complete len:619 (+) comp13970_c0_seq1:2-1858(+)